jgi:hypothetical protein
VTLTLFRCFRWRREARSHEPGGALWVPREMQGDGRHDAPAVFGCLYASEVAVSPLVEQLARFRGTVLEQSDFAIDEDRIALAVLELDSGADLVDLDDPELLVGKQLRPSAVATRARARTQDIAVRLFEDHERASGIRWWSTFEASWINVTLWDRALPRLRITRIEPLGTDHATVREAARFLELPIEPA